MDFNFIRETFGRLPAFGLDFSDRSIKVMQFCKPEKKMRLRSYNKKEIPEKIVSGGEIKNAEALIGEIKETMLSAKPYPVANREVVVSLPESKCFIRVIKTPKITEENAEEIIRAKAEEHFPLASEEMYLDWHILGTKEYPIGGDSNCTDVFVAATPKILTESYLEVIDKCGLIPVAFEAESAATVRGLFKNRQYPQAVLIIDLGRDRTSFIFYKHPFLRFTQSISISGESFSFTLSKGLKVNIEEAEKIKRRVGILKHSEEGSKVFKLLEPLLSELVFKIKNSISYYNNYFGISQRSDFKIIVCGGGANLMGIGSYLSLVLRRTVEVANPWEGIYNIAAGEIPPISRSDSLFYTTALGLALYDT